MTGSHLRSDDPVVDRRVGRAAVVVAVVLALLAGLVLGVALQVLVLDDDDPEVTTQASSSTSQPSEPDPIPVRSPAAAAPVTTPDPGPVVLAFVGDINAERSLGTRLEEDPEGFVGPFAEVLRGADLTVGNLEAAVAVGGTPLDKQFTFRVPPSILDALRAGGIDVLSAANNHGMDFGSSGLEETLAAKRALPDGSLIGVGADEDEAYAPYVADVGGHRVAIIAATQVIDGQYIASWTATDDQGGLASAKRVDRLVEEVRSVRAAVDTLVVYLHWGTETETCPNPQQRELSAALVEAGADVVVGGHSHRIQGAGMSNGAVVGYGLGNFLFGTVSEESAKTGALLVEIDGREVLGYEWRPGRIVDRVPQLLEGDAAVAALEEWNGLRECTGLAP